MCHIGDVKGEFCICYDRKVLCMVVADNALVIKDGIMVHHHFVF